MEDIKEQLKKIEESSECARCSCELDGDNKEYVESIIVLDSIPGGAGTKIRVPVCKDCKQHIEDAETVLASMRFVDYLPTFDEGMKRALVDQAEADAITASKRADEPWRQRGRSKKERRRHR